MSTESEFEALSKKLLSEDSSRTDFDSEMMKNGFLCSVTTRITQVKQPRGGYIRFSDFVQTQLSGGGIDDLYSTEWIHPTVMGVSVDYGTRYMLGVLPNDVFSVAQRGSIVLSHLRTDEPDYFNLCMDQLAYWQPLCLSAYRSGNYRAVRHYLTTVVGPIIMTASGYDYLGRGCDYNGKHPSCMLDDAPNSVLMHTMDNFATMVIRSLHFFEQYGPVIMSHLLFPGGYTFRIASGDGDFMTKDTLWDFKVYKSPITSRHTLQLLVYWRMGVHSRIPDYKNVEYLGIYNPRRNIVYRYPISNISADTIMAVDRDVIGYDV